MLTNNINKIITVDRDFEGFEEVRIISPSDLL